MSTRRPLLCALAASAIGWTALPGLAADAYPSKPIRLIVPFPPGGGTDLVSRFVMPALGSALGTQIIVDNRGGAQGTLGTGIAAKSAPDGYTLVIAEIGATAVAPAMYDKLGFDPGKDFAPISMLVEQPYVMSVHPSVPAKDLAEFLKLARSKQGGFNFGSGNTTAHVAQEVFYRTAGLKLTHVPYRGSGPAMTALLGNEVQTLFSGPGAALSQAKAGKIRPLAVTTLKRSSELPDVPTLSEQGFKNFEIKGWYGLMAPAGTPRPIVTRINAELTRLLSGGEVANNLRVRGYDPLPMSPDEFGKYMRAEIVRWGKAVKENGIKASD